MGTDQETKETTENRSGSMRQDYGFASDVELKECKYCRVMIPKRAKVCPNCKMDLKSHWFRKTIVAIFSVTVIGVGSYCLSAYWGLVDGAALPGWVARNTASVPAVSVATVGTSQADAGTVTVKTSDIAAVTVTAATGEKEEPTTAESDVGTGSALQGEETAGTEDASQGEETAGTEDASQDEGAAETKDTSQDEGAVGTEDVPQKEDADKKAADQDSGTEGAAENATDVRDTDGRANKQDAADASSGVGSDMEDDSSNRKGSGQGTSETDKKQVLDNEDEADTDVSGTDQRRSTADGMEIDQNGQNNVEDMDEDEAAFRADCVRVSYRTLLRKQEEYLGTALMLEVEVVCQVDGGLFDDHTYYLCMEAESSGIKRYYIIRDDRETDRTLILEGDTVTVYGQLFGNCKVPAGLVATEPTVPAVSMLYYDLAEE